MGVGYLTDDACGFFRPCIAVVDEVRALAESNTDAARETCGKIELVVRSSEPKGSGS